MTDTPKDKVTWNAQRIYRSVKRWIAIIADRVQEAATQMEVAAKGNGNIVPTGRFGILSLWNGALGVVGLMDGNVEALDHFHHAVYYQEAELHYLLALYMANPKSRAHILFNRPVLGLARAVTLGCWQEADQIAEMLRTGLAEIRSAQGKKYSAFLTDVTCVAPFILQLYAQSKGMSFPLDRLDANPLHAMGAYEPLLDSWQTTDLDALERTILAAYDLHLARSKNSNVSSYEFEDEEYMLHPVEILMVLRLRETCGLANPTLDHPLLNTPVGRLYPIRSVSHNLFLDQALANSLLAVPRLIQPHR